MNHQKNNEDFLNEIKRIDFSTEAKERDREKVKLMNKLIQIQEGKNMKKKVFSKRSVAAVLSLVVVFSTIAYGGQIVQFIKKQVTLGGYASYSQYDEEYLEQLQSQQSFEISDSEEIAVYDDSSDSIDDYTVKFESLEEAASRFTANLLTPSYLPEGYSFSYAELYKDETGQVKASTKYINLYYSNGQEDIIIMARYLDEETAFETGLSPDHSIIEINGYETLIDGNSVSIAVDNVLYTYFSDDTAEVVKMIDSMFE